MAYYCVCVCVCLYHLYLGAFGGQKTALDALRDKITVTSFLMYVQITGLLESSKHYELLSYISRSSSYFL